MRGHPSYQAVVCAEKHYGLPPSAKPVVRVAESDKRHLYVAQGDSKFIGERVVDKDAVNAIGTGLPLKPDRVIVMFGMNDVKLALWEGSMPDAAEQDARDKAVSGFRRELERLTDGLATAGVRCDLATPPPYDQYDAASKAVCRANGNEPGLARLAEVVRQIAAERGLGLVDVHRPLTDILKSHPELGLLRGDRIHPWWEGHLLLAVQYLEAMGEDGEVGRIELTASAAKRGFCYAPKRLPFPRLDVFWRNMERTVETAYPFEERFNREILVVKGLPAGRYAILADGREFASFDAAELAHGVNIATCDTPSQRCA